MTLIKREGRRLVYYISKAEQHFWDQHWNMRSATVNYGSAAEGKLGLFEELFTKYLPKQGRIIEAGCGIGKYVLALNRRGYTCEGIEASSEAIRIAKGLYPELDIRQGDVTTLDVLNETYSGYISLGVIEHMQEGPAKFLKEAHRILSDDGIAIFTVPHFNRLRQLKSLLGYYRNKVKDEVFYQYAYSRIEMRTILEKFGFEILEVKGQSSYKGIRDESFIFKTLSKYSKCKRFMKHYCHNNIFLENQFGHMLLFVCRKKTN